MEQMYAGIKTGSIDSGLEAKTDYTEETIIRGDVFWFRGDEKWLIGNYESAPRMYGSTFSSLEEKFTGLSCDPDNGYDDLSEADREKMGEEAAKRVYEITGKTPDEVFEILERESKKPWWQFWTDGVKYHIEDKDIL